MTDYNNDILESDIGMYTNLHAHCRIASPLDGFSDIEDYVIRAKAMGMRGVCFSDHGLMSAAYELEKICSKHGMKPIYANELYFTPNDPLRKEKIEGFKPSYHLLLIAYNQEGYGNLMKLSSDAWTKYRYYKPRVSWEQLEAHSEGLICLSACLGGYPQQMLLEGKEEDAEHAIMRFAKIFKGNYYLEMQWTGIPEQTMVNDFFRKMSKKHNVPLVITCDSHYTYKHESELHRALVTINTGGIYKKKVEAKEGELTDKEGKDTDESSMFYTPGEYYLKPYHMLKEYFNEPGDDVAFTNTNKIADMCNVVLPKGLKIFPQIIDDPDKYIMDECIAFLNKYCESMDEAKRKVYFDRLDEEYWTISRMGYCDYFVVVQDIIKYCIANNILVGPGRGSAAGCLVSYCLGITWIDPIEYGLLFSRFLSSSRAKLPLIEFDGYPISENNYVV
jgi:DNA polymerase-3 subunit alpha